MKRMPSERPRHDSRMSRRATYMSSVSGVLVAMFAFSASAQTSPTTAAEAEAAIGAATASTVPPIHPELAAPSVPATPQASAQPVLQRPAGTPIVVPSGTTASAFALVPSASVSPAASGAAEPRAAQVRPSSLPARTTGLAPSARVAPQSAAATVSGGAGAGGIGLAPAANARISGTSAAAAAAGAPPATGLAPPGSRVRLIEKSQRLSVFAVGGDSSSATAASPPEAEFPLTAPQSGQIQAPESVRSATEFKATLTARYEIEESLVSLEDHPDGGVRGHFSLRGDLTPASARSAQLVQQGPRAIAQTFLAEETASLGIAVVDDLRESLFSETGIGWTGITYHRFVGDLQLEHAQVSMSIDPEGRIRSVSGFLVPLPAALFEAAARPTISESAAHGIIRSHLVEAGENPNPPYKLKLIATSSAPYVIWNSSGTWIYRIDAFTGEILEKRSGMQSSGGILDRRGVQDR